MRSRFSPKSIHRADKAESGRSPAALQGLPELAALPLLALRALLAINPLLLMTASVAIGAALAHRVGLHSRIAGSLQARVAPGLAIVAGLLLAIVLTGLNAVAGIAYGWLFWRRSLEASMLAHATTHAGFAIMRLFA